MHFIEVRITETDGVTYNFTGGFENLTIFQQFLKEARSDEFIANVKVLDCICILGIDEESLNESYKATDRIVEKYYHDLLWNGRG